MGVCGGGLEGLEGLDKLEELDKLEALEATETISKPYQSHGKVMCKATVKPL